MTVDIRVSVLADLAAREPNARSGEGSRYMDAGVVHCTLWRSLKAGGCCKDRQVSLGEVGPERLWSWDCQIQQQAGIQC